MGRRKKSERPPEAEILLYLCVHPERDYVYKRQSKDYYRDSPLANDREIQEPEFHNEWELWSQRIRKLTSKAVKDNPHYEHTGIMPESLIQEVFIENKMFITRDGVKKIVTALDKKGFLEKVWTYTKSGTKNKQFNVWKVKRDKATYKRVHEFLSEAGLGAEFLRTKYARFVGSGMRELLAKQLEKAEASKKYTKECLKIADEQDLYMRPAFVAMLKDKKQPLHKTFTTLSKNLAVAPHEMLLWFGMILKWSARDFNYSNLDEGKQDYVAEQNTHDHHVLIDSMRQYLKRVTP